MVLVDDVAVPTLAEADRHHLARVLRLRPGDPVVVADGRGAWRPSVFTAEEPEPAGEVVTVPRPAPARTVAFTPTKGERPEWAVQKLTEVGIDRIVVLRSERSVVRWDGDRAAQQLARLGRIAREAAMQSRRAWLPALEGVVAVDDVVGRAGAVLADPGGRPLQATDALVLCGPEGGWTDRERSLGSARVALAVPVLRAETAAVVAGALLVGLRHGLVSPA